MEYNRDMDNNLSFSFFDGLQLLFIGLKLAGVIDWSWWAVMSPVLGSLAAGFIVPPLVRLAARRRFG